ncbi:alpha-1,6-mannosyl-glycoprotein 2-beta-N-acetylglucosaminyltransferase-like isoform X2 [Macrosteles quadrilineatus]|uniref:alpha-1,6-mannosyl-glycoprotein 2-beta-N-acetylglucosaminyltransferase-like isoform X2 n=1 Tax=Macrosteles quadrilineatus TaxID=74068 RepID=UPI0023E208CF|nr:alpha-1,6-mannosyl-glycoprotein 2-beta-N-acetylglucosaminyltransferase-like isoform X2 [Macrosteles quadrilineatus]
MTNYYKYLPMKSIRRSKLALKKRQTRQYLFALLLLLALIFMCLYEFYFTIMERAKNGEAEANILERIVCQVHRQIEYLKELISSLSDVPDADSMFLIFSHDYYSEDINQLVHSIDFAPVLQVFFPFSSQLYPNEFPGNSPDDCPWNLEVAEARSRECEGAQTPDQNGHFRQAEVSQSKHHWWWMYNMVFEKVHILKQYNGPVLFLEEGQFVAPDTVHMLRLMTELAAVQCPECNSFHLHNPHGSQLYKVETNKVEIAPWDGVGFAFGRGLWQALRACANVFCTLDDANWSASFLYAAQECFFQRLTTLVIRVSRVLELCESKSGACDLQMAVHEAKTQLSSVKPYMFPENVMLESTNYHQPHVRRGWGGWSDSRDIQLCLNLTVWPTSTVLAK